MSVDRVTEVIGMSTESWEYAARSAVETAAATSAKSASPKRPPRRHDREWRGRRRPGPAAISSKYESDR